MFRYQRLPAAIVIFFSVAACRDGVGASPIKMTVAEHGFAAAFYDATQPERPVGVLVLGGSEGGKSTRLAETFSSQGYPVLSLAYFKESGLPDYLDEIPLEYFDKPIDWLAAYDSVQRKQIVVVGASKGAELALLLASRKLELRGVIAISPSSVVFQGLPKVFWPPRSSWSVDGQSVPFVPYDASRGVDLNNLRPLYELSLSHADVAAKAAIPVEKINGPVLLLSGVEDGIWPAAEMAETIVERLKQNEFSHDVEHVAYEDAGHTLNEFHMIGGTREGNQQARLQSKRKMLAFLAEHFDDGGGQ